MFPSPRLPDLEDNAVDGQGSDDQDDQSDYLIDPLRHSMAAAWMASAATLARDNDEALGRNKADRGQHSPPGRGSIGLVDQAGNEACRAERVGK